MMASLFSRGVLAGLAAGGIALVAACTDSTDVELLTIQGFGTIEGWAYMDLNRSQNVEASDPALEDVEVILSPASSGVTLATATTDRFGNFLIPEVPVGQYRIRFSDDLLGDSLTTVLAEPIIEVVLGDTAETAMAVAFPELSVEELRDALPGRRVFTHGIALNVRDNPADGKVFLEGASAYVQALTVPREPNIAVGDSVRILGRTVMVNGQPMLQADGVPPVILVPRATVPVPVSVTTAEVGTAGSAGELDAALVTINHAEISDTASVGNEFHFTADDGSGPVRVVLRSFLGRSTSDLRPDTVIRVNRATGMIAPHDDGSGVFEWRLLIRSASELVTEQRLADVSVTASLSATTASQGESIDLEVVVFNAGPLAATGVEITDTLPSVLTRGTSTVTSGSYASTGIQGVWTLDRLEPGASDTLRATIDVTGTQTGTVTYVVRAGGLDREVDNDTGDNRATASVTLLAPR